MTMPKATFAQLPRRRAGAQRRARAVAGCAPGPNKLLHPDVAPNETAERSSGADALANEAGTRMHVTPNRAVAYSLTALNRLLLSGSQAKLLKQASAALAEALVGRTAPPSLQLRVRRGLRAAVLMGYAAGHVVRVCALAASLAHSGDVPPPGLATDVELANAACTLLLLAMALAPSTSPPLLLRAVAATCALAADWLDMGVAAEGLAALAPDLTAGVVKVVDLLTTGLSLVENCRELAEVAEAAVGRQPHEVAEAVREREREEQQQ